MQALPGEIDVRAFIDNVDPGALFGVHELEIPMRFLHFVLFEEMNRILGRLDAGSILAPEVSPGSRHEVFYQAILGG